MVGQTEQKTCNTCGKTKPIVEFDARLRLSRPAKPPYGEYCSECYFTQLCDNNKAGEYMKSIRRRLGDNELIALVDNFVIPEPKYQLDN